MNYQQTIEYMFSQLPMFQRQGASAFKKDLGNILALSDAIGNPHHKIKCIHIAGTNGKGSTAHILAAILQEAGYKTGLYTSPHYIDFRERIKIDGQFIEQEAVIDFVHNNQVHFEKIKPSFFEMTVAMAFDYFASQQVDIAIIETGLGGRLDSTNILLPLFSVITNIGLDHQAMLGNSLEKIAFEKAGIIKPKTAVIIGQKQVETTPVFKQKATDEQAELHFAESMIQLTTHQQYIDRTIYNVSSEHPFLNKLQQLETDLLGAYQMHNITTALSCCPLLLDHDFLIKQQDIIQALAAVQKKTKLMGRWQVLQQKPLVICDSGHNKDGIAFLKKGLAQQTYKRLHIVWGTVNDKDLSTILSQVPKDATYYFCKANIPRGLAVDELQQKAAEFDLNGACYASVKKAFDAAQTEADFDDCILIGGSIFVVGEALTEVYTSN